MPIRLLRRLFVYTPVIVLTVESFWRVICGAPWQPAAPSSICPESSEASSSCQRCPMTPRSAPSRSSCSLAQEELGQPSTSSTQSVRVPLAVVAGDARGDSSRPLLRRLAALRRLDVHGASPPIQLLMVTFRN